MIAFEIIHFLKNKRVGKLSQMAAKLDMSKAYDKVEWDYLKKMMLKLRFNEKWGGIDNGVCYISFLLYTGEW